VKIVGTASSYGCALSSLNKFAEKLRYTDVTPALLGKFEKWMLAHGNSIITVGIYARSLRTIFNNAIVEGLLTREYYPFVSEKRNPGGRP